MPVPAVSGDEQYRASEYLKALIQAVELQETVVYTYKTVDYATSAAYATGLATEAAADWEPISSCSGDRTINPGALVITYRKKV